MTVIPPGSTSLMVEVCTSESSELGSDELRGDCFVHRITSRCDFTTPAGLASAMAMVDQAHQRHLPVTIWGSLPCTSGCPWWNVILARYPKAKGKLDRHKRVLQMLLVNFEILCTYANSLVGSSQLLIMWEWPRHCQCWQDEAVLNMMKKHWYQLHCVY